MVFKLVNAVRKNMATIEGRKSVTERGSKIRISPLEWVTTLSEIMRSFAGLTLVVPPLVVRFAGQPARAIPQAEQDLEPR